MTREEWDAIAKARISAMMFGGRVKAEVAIRHANETTEQDYGPRPDPEPEEQEQPEPPWWVRAALRVTLGKEGSSMPQRILVALAYAVSAIMAAYQATGAPTTVEGWIGLAVAGVVAFWGKFSSSTTVLSPARVGETQATKPGVTL